MTNPEELERLASSMQKPRERYLKWKQVCDRYDRGAKSKLASIFMMIRKISDKDVSAAMLEKSAYASQEYEDYLKEWDNAEKEKIKAQVEYENLQCAFDALTSSLAYQRESMKRLG